MHVSYLDPYRPRPSLVHRLDARVKFVLSVAFILAAALTPAGAWPVFVLLLALVLSAVFLSELGLAYVLARSLLALPFVLAALPLLVTVAGPALLSIPLPDAILGGTLVISAPGLARFLSIAFRSWVSIQAAILLAASTPFPELLLAMRAVRLPRLLVAVFGLMWRYLFVLADEALRLTRARSARSGISGGAAGKAHPGGSLAWRARVTGGMAGNLLLRSFDRADRIYAAMASRGYDGEVRTFPLAPLSSGQRLLLAGGLALLAVLAVTGRLLWQ